LQNSVLDRLGVKSPPRGRGATRGLRGLCFRVAKAVLNKYASLLKKFLY